MSQAQSSQEKSPIRIATSRVDGQSGPRQRMSPVSFAGEGSHDFSTRTQEHQKPITPMAPVQKEKQSRITKFFDGVATASLFMIFFGFPLFFLSLTAQGIVFEKQLYFYFWLLIGLVGWVSKGIVSGELRIRRTPIDIPLLAFWITAGASSFFSVDKWHSVWGAFGDPSRGFLALTAIVMAHFFLASHLTLGRFRRIFGGMILSGTLVSIWTTLTLFGIPIFPESLLSYAPTSLFGTMRALTLFFGILLPLTMIGFFVLFQDFRNAGARFWIPLSICLTGLILQLYILFALYSFTLWLPILVGIAFFLVFILARVVHIGDRLNWIPMTLFIVLLVFLMVGNLGTALISDRTTLFPEVSLNMSTSWQIAKDSLKERLIVGSGPATYGYDFSLHRPESMNVGLQSELRFSQGGTFFLEVLPTIGVVGGFFFLILALTFFGTGIVGLSRDKSRNKPFALAIWSSTIMVLMAMFFVPMDGTILVYGVLVALLAIPVLLEESDSKEGFLRLSLKASPRFALALAFTFMVVSAGVAFLFAFLGKVFVADLSAGKANRIIATEGVVNDRALSAFGQSLTLLPYEGRYYSTLGRMYMMIVNEEASKPEEERDLDRIRSIVERSAVPLVDEGTRRMPNDVLAHEIAGGVYENVSILAGSDPAILGKTAEIYRRAMALEPMNPTYPIKLGLINRVLAARDDRQSERPTLLAEAKSHFENALKKKSDSSDAYLNLGLTEEALDNRDAAIGNLEKAFVLSGGTNRDVSYHLARTLTGRAKDGDLDRAEKVSLDALKRDERNVNILLNLAVVYEKKSEKEKAIETYEKLKKLFENNNGQMADLRKQIDDFITNVRSGKGNLSGGAKLSESEIPASPIEIPSASESIANTEPILPAPETSSESGVVPSTETTTPSSGEPIVP